MTRVYYKDAHAAIVVYDSTREATFEGALRWKSDLDNKVLLASGKPVPAILLSNKCDLDPSITESVEELAQQHGFLKGMDVSAKDNIGIDEAFRFLSEQVIATQQDGQYELPLYQRDGNIRRLTNPSNSSYGSKKKSSSRCC